jgi:hypothetical protein
MRSIIRATTVVALAGLVGGTATAWGQHGHSGSHEEGHRAAQACATEFEQVVGAGRGSAWRSRPIRTATRARCTCWS